MHWQSRPMYLPTTRVELLILVASIAHQRSTTQLYWLAMRVKPQALVHKQEKFAEREHRKTPIMHLVASTMMNGKRMSSSAVELKRKETTVVVSGSSRTPTENHGETKATST